MTHTTVEESKEKQDRSGGNEIFAFPFIALNGVCKNFSRYFLRLFPTLSIRWFNSRQIILTLLIYGLFFALRAGMLKDAGEHEMSSTGYHGAFREKTTMEEALKLLRELLIGGNLHSLTPWRLCYHGREGALI